MLPLLLRATRSIILVAASHAAWSRLPLRERERCHASPALRAGLLMEFIGDMPSVKLDRRLRMRGAGLGDEGVGADEPVPGACGVVSMLRSSSDRSMSLCVGVVGWEFAGYVECKGGAIRPEEKKDE